MSDATTALASAGPVIPNFGAHSSRCVVENRFFCPEWVSHNWSSVLWPALRQHVVLTLIAVAIGFAISMTLALAAHRWRVLERLRRRDRARLLHAVDPVPQHRHRPA
jgi:ABC-type nitrate/sulfonate/bicarbonate transport system permease component